MRKESMEKSWRVDEFSDSDIKFTRADYDAFDYDAL